MSHAAQSHKNDQRFIIIGGGYAGLAALVALRKQAPQASIHLLEPRSKHLITTRLHETVHTPLQSIQIPYQQLARRFNFSHVQQTVSVSEQNLQQWNSEQAVFAGEDCIEFDCLLIATGSIPASSEFDDPVFNLSRISRECLNRTMETFIARSASNEPTINIVGAGPSGLQFAFELNHLFNHCHSDTQINIIEGSHKLLGAFPREISRYVEDKLLRCGINLYLNQYYRGIKDDSILLEQADDGSESSLKNHLTLLLHGQHPQIVLHTNSSGQVLIEGQTLENIYSAGDCAHYDQFGSNQLTSQSAIRKGKAAANNMLHHSGLKRFCLPYMHQEIGYILSLGPKDAVGWLGIKSNTVKGLSAYLAKQASERQYELLLKGIDTYLV